MKTPKYKTKDYRRWNNMRQRCARKSHPCYASYGGRGITVCERWLVFENFLADMGPCPDGLTLDRVDNDGPYSKENCRYVDRKVQGVNRRTTVWMGEGEQKTPITLFCKRHKISYSTLVSRLSMGMSLEQAIVAPSKSLKLSKEITEKIEIQYRSGNYRLTDLAEIYGVGPMTIHRVVKNKYWRAA